MKKWNSEESKRFSEAEVNYRRYDYTQKPHENKQMKYFALTNPYEGFCPFPLSYHTPCSSSLLELFEVYRPSRSYSAGWQQGHGKNGRTAESTWYKKRGIRIFRRLRKKTHSCASGSTSQSGDKSHSQLAGKKGWQPSASPGTARKSWTPPQQRLGPSLRTEHSPLNILKDISRTIVKAEKTE